MNRTGTTTVSALEIRALSKAFGSLSVLQGISLEMSEGGFLVLVGPSGSGKSTLLSCIAGLSGVDSGSIWIGGRDVTRIEPAQRDIAMVFQSYALFPSMSVAENIRFGMRVRKVADAEQERRLARVSRMLKIDHLLDRRPAQLSGGQRQRVAMGRALVREPKLFLFDEPLSNLDSKLRVSMRTEIKRLHQDLGASIVYVTHDQMEAMTLATMIVVLKDGAIQQIGSPADIYERPANLFVADFMAAPVIHFLAARASAKGRSVRVTFDSKSLPEIIIDRTADGARVDNIPVLVGVRPEMIEAVLATDVTTQVNRFDARIEVVEPMGPDTYAVISIDELELTARLSRRSMATQGAILPFALNLEDASFFDPKTGDRLLL